MVASKKVRTIRNIALVGILLGVVVSLYLYNMPHRNVQSSKVDYVLTSQQIVAEYLSDNVAANKKYLNADGDSKILEVSGTVYQITGDYNGRKVVLLKEANDKAGVKVTFMLESNEQLASVVIGEHISIKGVIRSGASYDEDLEMYEHVIIEKGALSNNKTK